MLYLCQGDTENLSPMMTVCSAKARFVDVYAGATGVLILTLIKYVHMMPGNY